MIDKDITGTSFENSGMLKPFHSYEIPKNCFIDDGGTTKSGKHIFEVVDKTKDNFYPYD